MATRFCASCGAKLLKDASFCVECGERQPGAAVSPARFSFPLQRYAPLLVLFAVVAVGGGVILLGTFNPKIPPTTPGRNAPQGPAGEGAGNLPPGHPPLGIPEEVKQTIRDMTKQAEAAPDNVDAWKRLGEVQYRASQLDPSYLAAARVSYQHVLDLEPENAEVLRNLGNVAFDQDQHDAAIDYYQRYLKLKPDDLNVQTDMGTMYLAAGKMDEAVRQFEAVVKANPSFFQAQFNMAIAYRTMGQADKAEAALQKARGMATDEKTRAQVDQLLQHVKEAPPASGGAPGAAPVAPAQPAAAGGTFQADAEAVFRQNPILGPKVQRIEWGGVESAKVYVHEFPMDQMAPEMRDMFTDRMKGRIKEKKDAHKVTQTVRFELIDDATGKVLVTITE